MSALITPTRLGVISADEVSDIEQQLDDTNSKKEELQSEVTDLSSYLNNLESQINSTNNEIDSINEQIAKLEKEIEAATSDLELANVDVEKQYEQMKLRIRFMYEANNMDMMDAILGSKDFSEALNRVNYIQKLASYDREQLEKLNNTVSSISATKEGLEEKMAELESLKASAAEKRAGVIDLMNQTKGNISAYSDQIEEFEKQALVIEEQLRQARLASQTRHDAGTAENIENTYVEQGDDLKLLATIIYCEAGNQPYEGLLAVGSVVLNRVNSPRFVQNTVYDVIMSPGQFEPVSSGRFALYYSEDRATERCYQAAREVLDGNITGSWVFFIVNDGTRAGDVIGDHVFFYEW